MPWFFIEKIRAFTTWKMKILPLFLRWAHSKKKQRQNFHLSDSESPNFFNKKSRHGKLSKKKLHYFEMSQTRQGQLDTLKNNRLLTLKASHALIFYRKIRASSIWKMNILPSFLRWAHSKIPLRSGVQRKIRNCQPTVSVLDTLVN